MRLSTFWCRHGYLILAESTVLLTIGLALIIMSHFWEDYRKVGVGLGSFIIGQVSLILLQRMRMQMMREEREHKSNGKPEDTGHILTP